jgi:hypothetical protein
LGKELMVENYPSKFFALKPVMAKCNYRDLRVRLLANWHIEHTSKYRKENVLLIHDMASKLINVILISLAYDG